MTLPLIAYTARAVQNVTITPVPLPRFMKLMNESFGGYNKTDVYGPTLPNWTGSLIDTIGVYQDKFGIVGIFLIALVPFIMMYISQGDMKLSGVVGFFSSLCLLPLIPQTMAVYAWLLMALNVVIIMYGLVKP